MRWLIGREFADLDERVKLWKTLNMRCPHDHPAYLDLTGPACSPPTAVAYDVPGSGLGFDGIYRDKASFEPEGVTPFYTRKVIHDNNIYGQLIEARRKHESAKGVDWFPSEDFFPAYMS